jgi:LysR family nitrogen assimilation transcriptional regulator
MRKRLPSALDLRQLEYFIAVADSGTISRASAQLGIAQPTLSEALLRFERQLGVKLLIRGVRGIELTEAGSVLAEYGRNILRSVEHALTDVRQHDSAIQGMVSIALPPSLSQLLTVPLAESVHLDYPKLKLHITEGNSGHVGEWVKNEQVDIGVVYEGIDLSDLSSRLLLTEELFLISAPDNWPPETDIVGVGTDYVEFAAMAELPMMLPSQPHGLRELIDRQAKTFGVQLNVILEIDPLRPLITMLDRASGYSVLSHAAVAREVIDGRVVLIPIRNPSLQRAAYLVRKYGRPVSRSVLAVESMVVLLVAEAIERLKLNATLPLE